MNASIRIALLLFLTSTLAMVTTAQRKYSEWQPDTCFQGLHWRASKGDYNESAKKYTVYIQFRNSYQKRLAFSYIVKSSAEEIDAYAKLNGGDGRVASMNAGSEDSDLNTRLLTSTHVTVVFGYVSVLNPGETGVNRKYETCDSPGNRGATDYICARKSTPSCPNYQANAAATPTVPQGYKRASDPPENDKVPEGYKRSAAKFGDVASIKAKIFENLERGARDDGPVPPGAVLDNYRFVQGQSDLVIERSLGEVKLCTFHGDYSKLGPRLGREFSRLSLRGTNICGSSSSRSISIRYNAGPGDRNFSDLLELITALSGP